MQISRLILVALLIALITACGPVGNSSSVVTQERDVSSFSKVELFASANVNVRQGKRTSVVITGPEDILSRLETVVRNDTLIIRAKRRGLIGFNWSLNSDETTIELTVPDLESFDISGSGDVSIAPIDVEQFDVTVSGSGTLLLEELIAEKLDITISGSGDVSAAGTVDEQELQLSGSGAFQGADLASQFAEVGISGSGSVTLWVQEQLDIDISGSGNVEYYGDPTVSQQISGSGDVRIRGGR